VEEMKEILNFRQIKLLLALVSNQTLFGEFSIKLQRKEEEGQREKKTVQI
jgi:hypothetical protein